MGFAYLKPEEYEFISPGDFTTFSWSPDYTCSHGFDVLILSVT
jgi:hypothetical protein